MLYEVITRLQYLYIFRYSYHNISWTSISIYFKLFSLHIVNAVKSIIFSSFLITSLKLICSNLVARITSYNVCYTKLLRDYEINTILGEPVDLIYIIAFPSEIPVLANKIYNNSIYQTLGNKPHIFP